MTALDLVSELYALLSEGRLEPSHYPTLNQLASIEPTGPAFAQLRLSTHDGHAFILAAWSENFSATPENTQKP